MCHHIHVKSGVCSCKCQLKYGFKLLPNSPYLNHLRKQEISFRGVTEMLTEAKLICNFVYCRAALGFPQAAYFSFLQAFALLFQGLYFIFRFTFLLCPHYESRFIGLSYIFTNYIMGLCFCPWINNLGTSDPPHSTTNKLRTVGVGAVTVEAITFSL